MKDLEKYCAQKMKRNQLGFMKNMSIEQAKLQVGNMIKELKKDKSSKKKYLIFLDLRSAYDMVQRD